MPALFIGHGSPMNIIEENEFTIAWRELAQNIPIPEAILCISAHWETVGTCITGNSNPPTIHDFYGFPKELYEQKYPAPGSPLLAQTIQNSVDFTHIRMDPERGFDHGSWAVLKVMYPDANIPLIQLSLDKTQSPKFHYDLGRKLQNLRQKGVLIIGSGNIVHNLRMADFNTPGGNEMAVKFDLIVKEYIQSKNHIPLIEYPQLGKIARFAVPTNEHYLPLLYILGMQYPEENATFFCESVIFNSLSMRGVKIG